MAGLRTVSREERLGGRRWDAVLVGSGISSLVAAIRLGMDGHRVLVVEEERARDAFPALREPFFLAGAREHGLLPSRHHQRIGATPTGCGQLGHQTVAQVREPAPGGLASIENDVAGGARAVGNFDHNAGVTPAHFAHQRRQGRRPEGGE